MVFRLSSGIDSSRFALTLLSGVSAAALCAVAGTASAQTAAGPSSIPATSDAPAAEGATEDDENLIVVTGRRAAIESAIARKRDAESIVDSVVADDAGKLPDTSITEVLQRVSGVSIVRFAALGNPDSFSVQGSGVQVRGLSGVASRLNGRDIFGASGGRALLWGDVTPELMAAVDVYKSATADLIEGGTGGQIDLRTKMPFDFKRRALNGSFGVSYGDLAKKENLQGSFLVTDRTDTPIGEIGVLIDVAYSDFSSKADFFRMEPYYKTRIGAVDRFIPGGYDFGTQDFNRERTGVYVAVQWAPSPSLTLSQTFFQSRYEEDSFGRGAFVVSRNLAVDPATSTFDDNGGLIKSTSIFVRDPQTFLPSGSIAAGGNTGISRGATVTRDYATSFKWAPDGPLAVSGAIQFIQSKAERDNYDVFPGVDYPGTFGLDLTGDLPQISIPAAGLTALANPANYQWQATMPHNELNRGKQFAANLDATYSFDDSIFKSFKAGARYANRSERDLNNGYNWAALGRGWNGAPQKTFADARPGDVTTDTFDNFFRGKTAIPGNLLFPSLEMVEKMDRVGDHAFYGGQDFVVGKNGLKFLPRDASLNRTKTYAAYAMTRFGSLEDGDGLTWNGNAGVRVVKTENFSNGFFTQGVNQFLRNGVLTRTTLREDFREGGLNFTKVLPSVNVQILPTPQIHVRAAYNITMDNQTFNNLRATGNVGVTSIVPPLPPGSPPGTFNPGVFQNFTTDTGNPALLPTISHNIDLSAEWYPKQGTSAHLALFRKTLKNLPILTSGTRAVPVYFDQPTVTTTIENAQSTSIFNSEGDARINGLEVGARTFLDMLPGFLSGFGVEANYTFIDSSNPGDRYVDINGVVKSDLPVSGLSKHSFNATALYEKGFLSARVAYSWRSQYLMSTTANGTSADYLFFSAPATSVVTDISLPIYSEAYGQFDAGVRVRLSESLSLSVEGTNITNSTARTLMGGYNNGQKYIRSWFQSDRRISGSVNFAF